jgi:hypothetical protein
MSYTYDAVFGPGKTAPSAVIPVSRTGQIYGGPYTKAVTLTPGTPVAPGRAVFVKAGAGAVLLKLAEGGAVPVGDETGGSGTYIHGFAVVDADISASPGASVVILY